MKTVMQLGFGGVLIGVSVVAAAAALGVMVYLETVGPIDLTKVEMTMFKLYLKLRGYDLEGAYARQDEL